MITKSKKRPGEFRIEGVEQRIHAPGPYFAQAKILATRQGLKPYTVNYTTKKHGVSFNYRQMRFAKDELDAVLIVRRFLLAQGYTQLTED